MKRKHLRKKWKSQTREKSFGSFDDNEKTKLSLEGKNSISKKHLIDTKGPMF